jgi:hypothetical protein
MLAGLRHDSVGDGGTHERKSPSRAGVTRYLFRFVGVLPLPDPALVDRPSPVVAGTVELYQGQRYLVESVDCEERPPVAVLRKVRS